MEKKDQENKHLEGLRLEINGQIVVGNSVMMRRILGDLWPEDQEETVMTDIEFWGIIEPRVKTLLDDMDKPSKK